MWLTASWDRWQYRQQFVAVLTASVGLISSGMEFGWSSPAVPIFRNRTWQQPPVLISAEDAAWLETLYVLGSVCCLPVAYVLLQHLGRKRALLAAKSVSLLCWLLLGTARSVPQLLAARFFSGMAENILFVALPMYIVEVTQPNVRGVFASFTYLTTMIGILLVYSIVPFIPIYASSAVGAAVALLMISTFAWQPESPYFLLLKGREEAACHALKRLRPRTADVDAELRTIADVVQHEQQHRAGVQPRTWYQIACDLVRVPGNRKALLIMLLLNTAQNFCGSTVVTMNAHEIISASEDSAALPALAPNTCAIVFAFVLLLATVAGAAAIDHFGRKTLIVSSCVCTSLLLAAFATFNVVYADELNATRYYVSFGLLVAYAFAFKYGMGLAPIVLTGELFPPEVKPVGMATADLCFTVTAALSLQCYYYTKDAFGMSVSFYIFAAFTFLTGVIVACCVPETKGKSLHDIQLLLKGK